MRGLVTEQHLKGVLACVLMCTSGLASAQSNAPDPQCLVSFAVVDRGFVMNQKTMSCVLAEHARAEMLTHLIAPARDANVDRMRRRIERLETELASAATDMRWTNAGALAALVGNALSWLGLGTCLPSAGTGCWLAGLGGALAAKVGVVVSTRDWAQSRDSLLELKDKLEAARGKIDSRKERVASVRLAIIVDFNDLCRAVQTQCLEEDPASKNARSEPKQTSPNGAWGGLKRQLAKTPDTATAGSPTTQGEESTSDRETTKDPAGADTSAMTQEAGNEGGEKDRTLVDQVVEGAVAGAIGSEIGRAMSRRGAQAKSERMLQQMERQVEKTSKSTMSRMRETISTMDGLGHTPSEGQANHRLPCLGDADPLC